MAEKKSAATPKKSDDALPSKAEILENLGSPRFDPKPAGEAYRLFAPANRPKFFKVQRQRLSSGRARGPKAFRHAVEVVRHDLAGKGFDLSPSEIIRAFGS